MCCAEQSEEVRRELREELLALNKRKKEEREKLQVAEKSAEEAANGSGASEGSNKTDPLAQQRETVAELQGQDTSLLSRQVSEASASDFTATDVYFFECISGADDT